MLYQRPCGKHPFYAGLNNIARAGGPFHALFCKLRLPNGPFARTPGLSESRHSAHEPSAECGRGSGIWLLNAIMTKRSLGFELCHLRDPQRKALLPGGAWAHLRAMLRRTARGHTRLPQRLSLSPASTGTREAAFHGPV